MYKNSRIRPIGRMSSAAANSTLAARNHLAVGQLPSVPRLQLSYAPDNPGSRKIVELYVASEGETETVTCRVYQGKEIVNSTGTVTGYVISPLCSISAVIDSDASGIFGSSFGSGVPDLYVANDYTVTVSTTATTPKGVGASVGASYGGGVVAYSPTDAMDARVIITDTGNADFLLFDVYGGSATNRYVFAEAGV